MKSFIVLAALVVAACAAGLSQEDVLKHWESFKADHGKTYETEVEEMHRMKVFKENLIRINKHNARFEAGEVSFQVGVNHLADLHSHEIVERLNGLRPELKRKSDKTHVNSNVTWPWSKQVDWRKSGYVTPVKDQGQCGSCWSFSATGSLEGQMFKSTGKLVSVSEQNLVDCSTSYGNEGCNGGLMDSAFQYIKENGGIDTEDSYPYTAADGTCSYKAENSAGVNSGFVDVNKSEKDLQDAVTTVGPVSVAIDASNWSFQMYKSGIYDEPACSSTQLDHGVLAVGYGSEWLNNEYWIVKNSWGTAWGMDGYIHMRRNKKNQCGIATMASYPTV